MQDEEPKKAQIDLEESRDKYADLYDFAPVGYFTFNHSGVIEEVNLTGASLLGIERKKLLNCGFGRFVAEDDLRKWDRHLLDVHRNIEKQYCELLLKREDNSILHVSLESVRMDSRTGTSVVLSIVIDITERKRADEVLTEAKAFAESTLNNIDDIFYAFDLNGKFLSWNDALSRVTGYCDEELHSMAPTDFFEGEDIERIRKSIETAFKEGRSKQEAYLVLKNRRQIPYEFRGSVIKDHNGNISGFSGIGRDITERKLADEALLASEKLYRSLFENMLNGFAYCRMLFDDGKPKDFIYLAVNDAFESQTGLKNVVGKKVTDVIPGIRESDAELLEIYGKVALTGNPERFEMYVQALKMWFAISVYSPEKEYFVAVFDVVSDRKQVEEERKLTIRMMQLINNPSNLYDLMHGVTDLLKEWTGCDAFGIRLRDGDDFPYFETSGFPATFIEKENSLCAYGPDGKILRDGSGNPVLECMCGNILCGRFDPAKPFFTEHGSFWSNNTSALLSSTTGADRQARTRNRCNSEGYESVALIPLRAHNKVFGLLQINDHRPDRFTNKDIVLLENLADNLAIAMSQRQALESLRESEDQYRKLVNTINIGIFRTSRAGGSFIQANPCLANIHGYDSVEALLKVQVTDLWQNPEDRKDFIDELVRNGYVRNKELGFLKKDGTPILCSMNAAAQYDEKGNFKWIHGTVEDISERKKLEEQLRQSQKMESVGTLAGGVAHDFNNILTAIIGFGTMALKRIKEDEKTKEFIEEILAGANRAAQLTHGLLAFSRKQTITLKQTDLNDIVKRIHRMLVRVIGEDIDLRIMTINQNLPVLVDAAQIDQLLLNLATNARDAMPDGGFMVIQTEEINIDKDYAVANQFENSGKYAVLTVSDTGTGMDQKTRENIFEPFFTTKEVGKGTGLGLAMVYGIVKQHGGNIIVHSEPGKGTTFRVYLAMATHTAEAETETDQPLLSGRGETILLAEDDAQVRKVTRMYLQECGYKVIEAENGEEVAKKFIENKDAIVLLLLDVIMPGKNGREAYEEIRKLKSDIKAIFMSGYTDDIISRKGILAEGLEFISKPINPEALMRRVREVLDR